MMRSSQRYEALQAKLKEANAEIDRRDREAASQRKIVDVQQVGCEPKLNMGRIVYDSTPPLAGAVTATVPRVEPVQAGACSSSSGATSTMGGPMQPGTAATGHRSGHPPVPSGHHVSSGFAGPRPAGPVAP
eukprot:280927-Alexandrium_andersonii.AAC.1